MTIDYVDSVPLIEPTDKIDLSIVVSSCRQKKLIHVLRDMLIYKPENYFNLSIRVRLDVVDADETVVSELRALPGITLDIGKLEGNTGGGKGKSLIIETIKSGWVYILDDDNLIHENFFPKAYALIKSYPDKRVFFFSQHNRLAVTQDSIVGHRHIDTAMFLSHAYMFSSYKYEYSYSADGSYARYCNKDHPDKIQKVGEVLCYYNKFR